MEESGRPRCEDNRREDKTSQLKDKTSNVKKIKLDKREGNGGQTQVKWHLIVEEVGQHEWTWTRQY